MAFDELEAIFKANKDSVFSHRCSIHVHMGVGYLTVEQLITLVSTYIASEKLFFRLSGTQALRQNNSYCFPIAGSGAACDILTKESICSPDSLKKYKYCALNVYHLRDYGTLEFRHHPGTKDIDELRGWMNAIGALHSYATSTSLSTHVKNLQEVSRTKDYPGFIQSVFGFYLPGAENLSRSDTRLMILASKHFIADLF